MKSEALLALGLNLLLLVALYGAVWLQLDWLGWLVQAFVWVMFGLYLVALYSGDADKSYASPLPTWLGLLIDVLVLAMLLYADWYVTATVYALSCLAMEAVYRKSRV